MSKSGFNETYQFLVVLKIIHISLLVNFSNSETLNFLGVQLSTHFHHRCTRGHSRSECSHRSLAQLSCGSNTAGIRLGVNSTQTACVMMATGPGSTAADETLTPSATHLVAFGPLHPWVLQFFAA